MPYIVKSPKKSGVLWLLASGVVGFLAAPSWQLAVPAGSTPTRAAFNVLGTLLDYLLSACAEIPLYLSAFSSVNTGLCTINFGDGLPAGSRILVPHGPLYQPSREPPCRMDIPVPTMSIDAQGEMCCISGPACYLDN